VDRHCRPRASVLGNAVPTTPFNQASPIIRAGGYGATTAAYSYSEPEFLPDTFPPISGSILFPIDGFVWTIDISDAQGNRRVHFDTSVAPTLVGPGSLDLSASFLNDYTLEVVSGTSNPLQVEQLSVQGLKVKADANAALGNIRTRSFSTRAASPRWQRLGRTRSSIRSRLGHERLLDVPAASSS
jgi:hypothetical protein